MEVSLRLVQLLMGKINKYSSCCETVKNKITGLAKL